MTFTSFVIGKIREAHKPLLIVLCFKKILIHKKNKLDCHLSIFKQTSCSEIIRDVHS